MEKWIDVDPMDWFYRSVLESNEMKEEVNSDFSIIRSYTYGAFETDYPRKVHYFTSQDNQSEFPCPGFKPHKDNLVDVYIDGVRTLPSKMEKDKIFVAAPLSGGLEVVIICHGVPKMIPMGKDQCALRPTADNCQWYYPFYELEKKDDWVYDTKYLLNEKCVALGKSLRRVQVDRLPGESKHGALERVIGFRKDLFTIMDGYLYVSTNLNGVPMKINYNYNDKGVIRNRQNEPAVPNSKCVQYQGRFFPNATMMKYEFYVILERLKHNLYHRFTDRQYTMNASSSLFRRISDKSEIVGKWYEPEILNILEDKYADGCYVYPLYEDESFGPTVCITRAEMVVALSRFSEWALERFR